MNRYAIAITVFAVLCALPTPSSAAFSCSMVGGEDATVQIGKSVHRMPLWAENCEGVRVLSGGITACYVNQAERRVCRDYAKGQVISEKSLPVGGAARFGTRFSILGWLKGDLSSEVAGVRGMEKLAGFPYERVLLLDDTLRINPVRAGLSGPERFELREGGEKGAVALRLEHHNGEIEIKPGQLRRGQSYTWIVQASGAPPISGQFHLASAEEVEEVRAILKKLEEGQASSKVGLTLLQAQWLMDANFSFDAEGQLLAAGLQLK